MLLNKLARLIRKSRSNLPNNKFKSDSQRLAPSLQVSLVFMAQWFRYGVSVVHTLIWRYVIGGNSDLISKRVSRVCGVIARACK